MKIRPFCFVILGRFLIQEESMRKTTIEGVLVNPLTKFKDERGWLCELFRSDDLEVYNHPVMGYASITMPGVVRGPHEHVEQTDLFCFFGPSRFKLCLWDNRPGLQTYKYKLVYVVGEDQPTMVIVPPGVVHAYKNIGDVPGLVINCPNKLYRGENKKGPVDEIRHENDPNTLFKVDE